MKANTIITESFSDLGSMIRHLAIQFKIDTLVVVTDPNTRDDCYPLIQRTLPADLTPHLCCLPDGEQNKTPEQMMALIDFLVDRGAGRATLLVNLGGGVLCDLGGFVAAIYKRGIHCLNIPTTLLAQVDAAVGGKTGVNYRNIKNLLGTFTPPAGVYINPVFLATLPDDQWRSGMGELFKYALIGSGIPLADLRNANQIAPVQLLTLIRKAIAFKEMITIQDPYDYGVRRILNFGHTIGHALEAIALSLNMPILHGEAVAAGLVAETWMSVKKTGLEPHRLDETVETYKKHFQTVNHLLLDIPALIGFMHQDKKNTHPGTINPVLINEAGSPIFDLMVSAVEIEKALLFLKSISR